MQRWTWLALCAAAVLAACSGQPAGPDDGINSQKSNLDLGGGVHIDSVSYVLTGPASFMQTGALPVGASSTITATFNNIPKGTGYKLNASGWASDNITLCKGDASFDMAKAGSVTVKIPLECAKPPAGSLSFQANTNVCPVIEGLSVWPLTALVGSTVTLALTAQDPDKAPAPLSATWSTTSGALSATSITGAVLTCTAAATATVSVSVSDGDPVATCPATTSVNISCVAH
jgi:hypothetical protein